MSESSVAYLDLTGSGAETAAHLRDSGRITFMFCGLSGKPNIVRLYGAGKVYQPRDPDFVELRQHFVGSVAESDGAVRTIITAS